MKIGRMLRFSWNFLLYEKLLKCFLFLRNVKATTKKKIVTEDAGSAPSPANSEELAKTNWGFNNAKLMFLKMWILKPAQLIKNTKSKTKIEEKSQQARKPILKELKRILVKRAKKYIRKNRRQIFIFTKWIISRLPRLLQIGFITIAMNSSCVSAASAVVPEIYCTLGDNVEYPCWDANEVQYCRIQIPYSSKEDKPNLSGYNSSKALNLSPKLDWVEDYRYHGKGLQEGQCGFEIRNISEKNNGIHLCYMGFSNIAEERIVKVKLTVLQPPSKMPELRLSGGPQVDIFREGDLLNASCAIRNTRPHSNLTIWLGGDKVQPKKTVVEHTEGDLYSTILYFEFKMTWKQNGMILICQADHMALPPEGIKTNVQINVYFKPTEDVLEEEIFGFVVGEVAVIKKPVKANPQPSMIWGVKNPDGMVVWVPEKQVDQSGRFRNQGSSSNGNAVWDAVLEIHVLEAEDVKNTYILRTENPEGRTDYVIRISTQDSPPATLRLGTWEIIGTVVAVMVVILVAFIVCIARMKGKWCFARTEPAPENNGNMEISDTESAVDGSSEKKNKGRINFSGIFKKKKDKVASDVEELKDTNVDEIVSENAQKDDRTNIVYAELDWQQSSQPVVKKEDDNKTEYAEILHPKKE